MPKLKTRKAVKKRFRQTATGKFLKPRTFRRHLLGDKRSTRKRKLRRADLVGPTDELRVRAGLPYG